MSLSKNLLGFSTKSLAGHCACPTEIPLGDARCPLEADNEHTCVLYCILRRVHAPPQNRFDFICRKCGKLCEAFLHAVTPESSRSPEFFRSHEQKYANPAFFHFFYVISPDFQENRGIFYAILRIFAPPSKIPAKKLFSLLTRRRECTKISG